MTKEIEKKGKEDVVIHIDKKKVNSPTPTTGAALYILGEVNDKYDLWEEVHGNADDILIPNDNTPINLKNGTHFYTTQKDLNPGHE